MDEDKVYWNAKKIWITKEDMECLKFYQAHSRLDLDLDEQPETKEDCKRQMETFRKLARGLDLACYDKDRYSNSADRAYYRMKNLLPIFDLEVEWEYHSDGLIRFLNPKGKPLIYSLATGKWRQEGKSKWYKSSGIESFVERYIEK